MPVTTRSARGAAAIASATVVAGMQATPCAWKYSEYKSRESPGGWTSNTVNVRWVRGTSGLELKRSFNSALPAPESHTFLLTCAPDTPAVLPDFRVAASNLHGF